MRQEVPKCRECEHCRQERLFDGGMLRDLCYHPAWKDYWTIFRRIKTTERRKTSPRWCPLRRMKNKP